MEGAVRPAAAGTQPEGSLSAFALIGLFMKYSRGVGAT